MKNFSFAIFTCHLYDKQLSEKEFILIYEKKVHHNHKKAYGCVYHIERWRKKTKRLNKHTYSHTYKNTDIHFFPFFSFCSFFLLHTKIKSKEKRIKF